ncbi:MAG: hypothetical protein GF370_00800 [Candidatus Nealsonbacteria bacterium]|nr:hypothetical protein [Candidatus Nealsonbacteria bacterium]
MTDNEILEGFKAVCIDSRAGMIDILPQKCKVEKRNDRYLAHFDSRKLPFNFKGGAMVHLPSGKSTYPVSRIDKNRKIVVITL